MEHSEMKTTTLIVSGPPRSGTTLLYNLFDGHPDISWMMTEGYFFEYLYDCGPGNADIYCALTERDVDDLVAGIRDRDVLPNVTDGYRQINPGTLEVNTHYPVRWNEQAFTAALAAPRSPSLNAVEALWARLSGAYFAGLGEEPRKYTCIKSPDYGKSAFAAVSELPDARAVVILRDPIQALDSLKCSRARRNTKLLTWATLATVVAQYRNLADRLGSGPDARVRVIRYEDLVSSTQEIMADLARWLDIPFTPILLEPTFMGEQWAGHSSRKETSGIDKELVSREIKCLTSIEVAEIRKLLASSWRKIGYEL
jgi:hypothetical protein